MLILALDGEVAYVIILGGARNTLRATMTSKLEPLLKSLYVKTI
jgi:hypothetical protein